MAHLIANVNGKNSMAYVGEAPWHGLGQVLTEGASHEVWTQEAGLNFLVERAAVQYQTATKIVSHESREVLFRDDTLDALGIVSKGYKIVQPKEVIDFFSDLADKGGFQLETAGALKGGQIVWALAKVAEGFKIGGKDAVNPYVLMTTSFDGSTATSARLTAIRVVCNNTLSVAVKDNANVVRVPHNSMWDAKSAKLELGLIDESWTEYERMSQRMAETPMTVREADSILTEMLAKKDESIEDTRKQVAYQKILDLFYNEKAIGAELCEMRSVWSFTNCVTEFYDHHVGKLQDLRVRNAWYGAGNTMKTKAWTKAAELVK